MKLILLILFMMLGILSGCTHSQLMTDCGQVYKDGQPINKYDCQTLLPWK